MRANGLRTATEIQILIAQWAGLANKSRREAPAIELLALAAGIKLNEFVLAHSTLPFRRSITSYRPEVKHGCTENKDTLFISGMRVARDEAYFCLPCAQTDIDEHGMTYWRRSHQLPGRMACEFHESPLRFVNEKLKFYQSPMDCIEESISVSQGLANVTMAHDGIKRFLGISSALMSNRSPISPKELQLGLRYRITMLGLRTHCSQSGAPLLSDHLTNSFPREWLLSVFPDSANKRHGEVMAKVDAMLQLSVSTTSAVPYLLVYSALFDSVEEGLSALKGATPAIPIKRTRNHRRKPDDNLLNDYVQTRGVHKLMQRQEFIDKLVISAYLDNVGLPDLIEDETGLNLSAVLSFFLNRKSLSESAKIGGLSIDAFEDIVRKIGCHIQPILKKIAANVVVECQSPQQPS